MTLDQFLNVGIPALAMILGLFLKRQPWFDNKFIPAASLALAALIRLATGLGVPQPDAEVSAVVHAGLWGSLGRAFLDCVLAALRDAVIATGIHSGIKNSLEAQKPS